MSQPNDVIPVVGQPLADLRPQMLANCDALATRRPGLAELIRRYEPRQPFLLLPQAGYQQLAVQTPQGIQRIRTQVGPVEAQRLLGQLYPTGVVQTPPAIFGEDLGWLWTGLYALPATRPDLPGHRVPLYLLVRDVERLWLMMHLHDWRTLLADNRVLLFVGQDAFEQLRRNICDEIGTPWPQISITLDPSLLPPGTNLNLAIGQANEALQQRFAQLQQQLRAAYAGFMPRPLAERMRSGQPLRVLGITSRYTTFLQHSMRDWLAAFERLGHQTRLVIETADHLSNGPVAFAEACLEFKPDLVVVIDHFRKELVGLPEEVPVAMWVQDALPNLFSPAAGAAQGPLDYSLGFARLKMLNEFGYPASRYMPAVVGLNDARFQPSQLSAEDEARYGCDIAFVSHASMPAEAIVEEEIVRSGNAPAVRRLFMTILGRMQAIYARGESVTEPVAIERIILQAITDEQLEMSPQHVRVLLDIFVQRVNNALFRHQSLEWVAELGVKLNLWGRGWERHPTLSRYAMGVAENAGELPKIYQASRVNLQVTPHGAVHQRTMEGLAAGGFFLLRHCPGDEMECDFKAIYAWCWERGITTDEALQREATPEIRQRLAAVAEALQFNPFTMNKPFMESLLSSEDDGYIRSAATVWAEDYEAVAFRTKADLQAKIRHYLANEAERRERAASMRQVTLDRFTYVATTRRLLAFIASDLAEKALQKAA